VYQPYVVGEHVVQQVQRKASRYRGATAQPILLLLYVTHWQFCLSHFVFWHVAYRLARTPPLAISMVLYMSFLENSAVETVPLYPVSSDFATYDPERYRENVDVLLNPHGWRLSGNEQQ
jgi:hypothetical protein